MDKLQKSNDSFKRTFSELEAKINENNLLTNIKQEGNNNANIEEIGAKENMIDISLSEGSTNHFYPKIIKKEVETSNVQDYDGNINYANKIFKDKIRSCEVRICEKELLTNIKEEANIDSNIEELNVETKLAGDAIDVKEIDPEEHSSSEDSTDPLSQQEGNIDSNIEEIEAEENVERNVVFIKEEFSISDDSTDSFNRQNLKDETESNNINCGAQITKDKINSIDKKTTDLKCLVCNERFVNKSKLLNHMKVHARFKESKCSVCGKIFKYALSLRKHMEAHVIKREYKCTVCNKLFVYKSHLIEHIKIHTDVKDYKCTICNKMFIRKSTLRKHTNTHSGVKDYKCETCNKLFGDKFNLKRHMTTHTGEKDHKCAICNKMFASKELLKRHMPTHTGIKEFECNICNKRFLLKLYLQSHMKRHKINSIDEKGNRIITVSETNASN